MMTKQNEVATLYREVSARGNHPVGLVVKLYDAILEDLRYAMNAIAAGDVQGRTSSLNHVLKVIGELQSVLDHERGGEVSPLLNGFYNVTRPLILEANLHADAPHIQRLIDLFLPLCQAWKQVEREVCAVKLQTGGGSGTTEQGPAGLTISANDPSGTARNADSEIPRAQWSA